MKEELEEIKICMSFNNAKLLRDSILDILSCTRAKNIELEINEDNINVEIKHLNVQDNLVKKLIK